MRKLRWEYDQVAVDVSTLADPPNSRPPEIAFRRRMVGEWEHWEPNPGRPAPVFVDREDVLEFVL